MTESTHLRPHSAASRPASVPDVLQFRRPGKADGPAIHRLIADCPPLDLNSVYTYLLLAEHFGETCLVASDDEAPLGFISAYFPPGRPDVLFVWQVAVHPRARGRRLGQRMLRRLLTRMGERHVRYIETTVGPGNAASRRMFGGLAARLDVPIRESSMFDRHLFGDSHEAEPLLRIGPLPPGAAQRLFAA